MKKKRHYYLLLSGLVLFILTSCQNSENDQIAIRRLNSFQMEVNGELWMPSVIDNDTCTQTFKCSYSQIDDRPFYTIMAYKDSHSEATIHSDNIFRLQIMNVREPGVYPISDTDGDFKSYARFIVNSEVAKKTYLNDTLNSSSVEIIGIIPIDGSVTKGVHGKFSGVLFNTDNRNDSIVITDCNFYFERVNWNDFDQCSMN